MAELYTTKITEELAADRSSLITEFRSGIGSLQWLAGTTRGDLAADVSLLQKPPSELMVSDLQEVNKVIKYARATSNAFFKVTPLKLEELLFITYGDSGWANAPKCKSQGGYVIVATNKGVLEEEQPASLLDWKSFRHQRILRSTLAAEAASLDRAHDTGQFIACVFSEMVDPTYRATCGTPLFEVIPVTDARSLWDSIHRLSTSFAEKRVEIDVAGLRQSCRNLRWVPTEKQAADALTKRCAKLRDSFRRCLFGSCVVGDSAVFMFRLQFFLLPAAFAGSVLRGASGPHPPTREISKDVLHDKLMGYWVGQLVGNFMGLPFEFTYWDEPMPIEPHTYYDEATANASGLNVNGPCETDGRGCIPQRLTELQGAYTDDDTDIEFVTLHALMEHGLDLTYAEIAEYWKTYINIKVNGSDTLWFANRVARENMDTGMLPPETGSKKENQYWWTIDPQLVNELWSAIYPGMVKKAVERAEWGARITSDSWGTHPTRFYAAMYSAAFFITDVSVLYRIGRQAVPKGSPFRRALVKVWKWHKQSPDDWRPVWQKIRDARRKLCR
eukprot:g19722.t1